MWLTRQGSRSSGPGSEEGRCPERESSCASRGKRIPFPRAAVPLRLFRRGGGGRPCPDAGRRVRGHGLPPPMETLSQGEVRIYLAGGAEILLKNTGEVVINGQVFAAEGGE